MSEGPFFCVVDANVALQLVFQQPGSRHADALFARLARDAGTVFYVPDFFFAECASALLKYVRFRSYSAAAARRDMRDIAALALTSVPSVLLAESAIDLAARHRMSGYDALYAALALHAGCPLVTADAKLLRALEGSRIPVVALAAAGER